MKANKKAQVSVEYIMIVGITFLFILPFMAVALKYSDDGKETIASNHLTGLAVKIADTAEQIHYLGEPSRKTMEVYVPEGLEHVEFKDKKIYFRISNGEGSTDIAEDVGVDINGSFSVSEGNKRLKIEARGDSVWVGE